MSFPWNLKIVVLATFILLIITVTYINLSTNSIPRSKNGRSAALILPDVGDDIVREVLAESLKNEKEQGIREEWIDKVGVGRKEDIFAGAKLRKSNLRGSHN